MLRSTSHGKANGVIHGHFTGIQFDPNMPKLVTLWVLKEKDVVSLRELLHKAEKECQQAYLSGRKLEPKFPFTVFVYEKASQ